MKKVLFALIVLLPVVVPAQQKFTFVFLHKRADKAELPKEEVDKIMEGHMANINRLASEGKLVAAGPFEGGGGIFIFNSGSVAEVKEWLQTDPGIRAERWNVEILPYEPRIGGVCTVGEPYEMVSYTFVHFKPQVMKFNVQNAEETLEKHFDFVKKLSASGNVVTEATFGGLDGGILVMRGEVQQEAILGAPAVAESIYEAEFKKLWIAKGAFCEK